MICLSLKKDTVMHKTCKKWYQKFRNSDFCLTDEACSATRYKRNKEHYLFVGLECFLLCGLFNEPNLFGLLSIPIASTPPD